MHYQSNSQPLLHRGPADDVGSHSQWNELDVVPLSDSAWRVSDTRKPERDGMAIVGVIEQAGARFRYTSLAHPDCAHIVDTFEQALEELRP